MGDKREEVTTMVSRQIKRGHELDYANWFGRLSEAIRKAPGFSGMSVIIPGKDPDARIVLYRFADAQSMEDWENSPERKALMVEVKKYATQSYAKMGGMETWFHVPDVRSV